MTPWSSSGRLHLVPCLRSRTLTLLFLSCGFDACEHEYASMSRHQRKVPVTFYHRFARDTRAFAERYAKGRVISVLEGGYSDRALTSGALAHLSGLVDNGDMGVDESWWSLENLTAVRLLGANYLRDRHVTKNFSITARDCDQETTRRSAVAKHTACPMASPRHRSLRFH